MEKKANFFRALSLLCALSMMLVLIGRPIHSAKAATSSAPFLIDSFEDVAPTSLSVTTNTNNNQSFNTAAAIDNRRNVSINRISGNAGQAYTTRTDANGHFAVSAEASVTGDATLTYDGTSDSSTLGYNLGGGAGISLTSNGNDSLYVKVLSSDFEHTIRITVYSSATSCSSLDKTSPANLLDFSTPIALVYYFTYFNLGAGCATEADFSQIKAIQVYITSATSSADLMLDEIGVSATDYGDASGLHDYFYSSFSAMGHVIDSTQPILGSLVDGEYQSLFSEGAVGDNLDTLNDEDGVFLSNQPWVKGQVGGGIVTVDVTAGSQHSNGCLWGWIDWDTDGWFDNFDTATDSSGFDRVIKAHLVSAGRTSIPIVVPANADNYVYARFRLFPLDPSTGTCENGLASPNSDIFSDYGVTVGGEVEDYYWKIDGSTAVEVADFQTGLAGPAGISVRWNTVSEADVLGFNLLRAGSNSLYTQLNASLIPAQTPGDPSGNSYLFTDSSALPGVQYSYKLQVVDTHHYTSDFGVVTGSYFRALLPISRH